MADIAAGAAEAGEGVTSSSAARVTLRTAALFSFGDLEVLVI
jgi:hypothetical protein